MTRAIDSGTKSHTALPSARRWSLAAGCLAACVALAGCGVRMAPISMSRVEGQPVFTYCGELARIQELDLVVSTDRLDGRAPRLIDSTVTGLGNERALRLEPGERLTLGHLAEIAAMQSDSVRAPAHQEFVELTIVVALDGGGGAPEKYSFDLSLRESMLAEMDAGNWVLDDLSIGPEPCQDASDGQRTGRHFWRGRHPCVLRWAGAASHDPQAIGNATSQAIGSTISTTGTQTVKYNGFRQLTREWTPNASSAACQLFV